MGHPVGTLALPEDSEETDGRRGVERLLARHATMEEKPLAMILPRPAFFGSRPPLAGAGPGPCGGGGARNPSAHGNDLANLANHQ